MSKVTGLFRKQRGSVGDVTFRQVSGVSIMSEKANPSQPRTFAQMRRRVQFRNIQNMWSVLNPYNHPSFQEARGLLRDSNIFMSRNLGMVPVYLTAGEAKQGAVVVAPYQVTSGSLPSISVSANGTSGEVGTDISLGTLVVSDSTTLKQFSDAIVENNPHFLFGDQITAYVAYQSVNTVTGVPYVDVKAFEVTLDHEDTETLIADLDPELLVFAKQGSSDKLGMNQTVNGGVVYIHSRKSASKTLVSSQRIVVSNTLLARYQSGAKLTEAINSYGGSVSANYLTPNVDEAPAVA